MAIMGSYCKAYPLSKLRAFTDWQEMADNARVEEQQIDDMEVESPRPLTDDDILFLQENYVVTDGIFIDENIIFNAVSEAWIDYCRHELAFSATARESVAATRTE